MGKHCFCLQWRALAGEFAAKVARRHDAKVREAILTLCKCG